MNKKAQIGTAGWVLIILGIIFFVFVMWIIGSYNGLVRTDTNVEEKWGYVQTAYQRRFDLIPNLVTTVKAYSDYEGEVLTEITAARSAWGQAKTPDEGVAAANQMESALARLLVVVENYPNLKANENYLKLQDELAGTENRIKYERDNYNTAVKEYKRKVRSFPTNMVAGMFGFTVNRYSMFEAAAGAEEAPKVSFD